MKFSLPLLVSAAKWLLKPIGPVLASVALLAHGAACSLHAAPVAPTDNTSAPYFGNYGWGLAAGGVDHSNDMKAWLNRSRIFGHEGEDYMSWTDIEGQPYVLRGMAGWLAQNPGSMCSFTVSMLPGYKSTPSSGLTMANGASGAYDAHFTTLATNLVAQGLGNNVIIRIGHEFNGNWYPWHILHTNTAIDPTTSTYYDDRPANYAAYWQHIVTAMRAVAPNLKFEWCGAVLNYTPYPIADAYPGDIYVDYIGTDIYDACYAPNTYPYPANATPSQISACQQTAWVYESGTSSNGLAAWKAFAVARSKPFTIPEWGVSSTTDGHGGLDNPYFIQQMYNFIQDPANNVYRHCYFDVQALDGHHQISPTLAGTPTEFPKAAALFRHLFGLPPFPNNTDIGTVGLAGSGSEASVLGAGLGYLTGMSDNFHFSSRSSTGNDALLVQVQSASATTAPQSGIMLRQDTTAGAAYAALFVANGKCIFQSRTATGSAAVQNATLSLVSLPVWLKLVRQGNVIIGYESPDNLNWTWVGAQTVPLTGTAALGVAVSSGNTGALNTVAINSVDYQDILTSSTGSIADAIIQDDTDAGVIKTGTWSSSTSTAGYYGTDYITDGNTGKGTKSVQYSPNLPAAGLYDVYVRWTAGTNRASIVPMSVTSTGGTTSFMVDQTAGVNRWVCLGTYDFAAGTSGNVVIRNDATNATTIADAIMYVPAPVPVSSTPLADTYVQDGTYANTNFGAATVLWTKSDLSPYNRNAFLRFNVSGMSAINRAQVQFTPTTVGPDTAVTYTVELVSDDTWSETGMTWNTKPAGTGVVLGQLSGLQVGVPVSIDITDQVEAEADGDGALSIRIYSNSVGTSKYINFGSKENPTATNRPQLLVQ